MNEVSAIVLASGRLVRRRSGGPAHVDVDWKWALRREESTGDIAGFYHTHPAGFSSMSSRDRRTMQAWASSFGRPLLCAIRCGRRVRGWTCDKSGGAAEVASVKLAGSRIEWTR